MKLSITGIVGRSEVVKVRICTTVDVDPKAWACEYGIDYKDVRKDVKAYFSGWPQGQIDELDLAPVSVCCEAEIKE